MAGTYRLSPDSQTRLTLHSDKTFEFVKNFNSPGPVFFPDSTELNFRTIGKWQLVEKKLVLNSDNITNETFTLQAKDSVTSNTDITSFSFWDKYGEPVPIRLIRFPLNRTKLHKSNVISFFAEDFTASDTLEFHFYGYKPYRWISQAHDLITNSQHRIILSEELRPGYFINMVLSTQKNKLINEEKTFALYKTD